jgi:hypothetical protein
MANATTLAMSQSSMRATTLEANVAVRGTTVVGVAGTSAQ